MSDSTWLESLKPGDEVVCVSGHGDAISIRSVDRITPTQIIVYGGKYRRKDGNAVGYDGWYVPSIRQPDDSIRAFIRKKTLCLRLQRNPWSALPLETLEAVAALVWPSTEPKS